MEESKFTPTYYNVSLREAIDFVRPERKPLIENFLYEKTSLMLFAPDGVGKSVLALQACMQATVGETKVFGQFDVPKPCKILYFQLERDPDETFERMKHMEKGFPFDISNFALSVILQGKNLQEKGITAECLEDIRTTVAEIKFKPDIICFDPIYTLVAEGLEVTKACNAVTNFLRSVQLAYRCAIIAVSHANRGVRDLENPGKRVGEDLYGNRFLSAHFGGIYQIESIKDGAGTRFKLVKSSLKNMEKSFELFYDPQLYRSMVLADGKLSKKDKLDNFLKTCKQLDKTFTFEEMLESSGLSDSPLRGHLSGYLKDTIKEVSKLKYGKLLYKYFG